MDIATSGFAEIWTKYGSPLAEIDTKVFRKLWGELKKRGWRSRAPRGLEIQHAYLKPGATLNGTRGDDFFVGEKELCNYMRRGMKCEWHLYMKLSIDVFTVVSHRAVASISSVPGPAVTEAPDTNVRPTQEGLRPRSKVSTVRTRATNYLNEAAAPQQQHNTMAGPRKCNALSIPYMTHLIQSNSR